MEDKKQGHARDARLGPSNILQILGPSLFAEFPKKGGLIAYGPNLDDLYRRGGEYVGKVLKGAKPSELPLQRAETFDLVINLKTATAIGVELPARLQLLANELVE